MLVVRFSGSDTKCYVLFGQRNNVVESNNSCIRTVSRTELRIGGFASQRFAFRKRSCLTQPFRPIKSKPNFGLCQDFSINYFISYHQCLVKHGVRSHTFPLRLSLLSRGEPNDFFAVISGFRLSTLKLIRIKLTILLLRSGEKI